MTQVINGGTGSRKSTPSFSQVHPTSPSPNASPLAEYVHNMHPLFDNPFRLTKRHGNRSGSGVHLPLGHTTTRAICNWVGHCYEIAIISHTDCSRNHGDDALFRFRLIAAQKLPTRAPHRCHPLHRPLSGSWWFAGSSRGQEHGQWNRYGLRSRRTRWAKFIHRCHSCFTSWPSSTVPIHTPLAYGHPRMVLPLTQAMGPD